MKRERDYSPISGVNPGGFAGIGERAAYVKQTYFSALRPGCPFMLVVQYVENQQTSCSLTHGTYDDFITTESYAGILSDDAELFKHEPSPDAFVISTARYVRFTPWSKMTRDEGKRLRIYGHHFLRTPLDGEFEARNYFFRSKPRAFTVAVGREAVEELCLSDRGKELELPGKYVWAAHQLGIGLFQDGMRAVQTSIRYDLMVDLLAHRSDVKRRDELLRKIAEFGFDKDTEPVRILGIRYRPNELVEDIRMQV